MLQWTIYYHFTSKEGKKIIPDSGSSDSVASSCCINVLPKLLLKSLDLSENSILLHKFILVYHDPCDKAIDELY